jgi:hypothetical protein
MISEALGYNFFTEIYGASLPKYETKKADERIITITISSEKVSLEEKTGITKIAEYQKIHKEYI